MSGSHYQFSEERPFRWGVIGCGSVAEKKSVPAYLNTPGFEVPMVMRRNLGKANDYAEGHGIPFWTDNADDVITHPEIDAIYIATPPDSHKFYALKVAEAGKPCCIEKPMAPNYWDSLEIFEAFRIKNLPLFIAYYRRSLPRFLKIKEWLDGGSIGTVEQIHWKKTKPPNDLDVSGTYNWRTDHNIAKGGYFDDLASHGLDLFSFLLGDIIEPKGTVQNKMGLYSAHDFVTATWVHDSGVIGSGIWDFGTEEREDSVAILGSAGKINFSVLDEAPLVLENDKGIETIEIPNPDHIQKFHVANIKNHLLGKSVHPSTGKTGLHVSWVMDKILGTL